MTPHDAEVRRLQLAHQHHELQVTEQQRILNRSRPVLKPLGPRMNLIVVSLTSIAITVPWLAALIFVLAHGFERHQFPALPYGIPLLIGILVAALGVLITTRFKFSWMVLSFAAATYAAFNL